MSALVEVRTRIESTGALIAQYEAAITRDPASAPPSLYVNIRSLEKLLRRLDSEFQELAQSQGLEVYRYRLLNEDDAPSLAGVAEAWSKFQAFFGTVYAAIGKQSSGKKSGKMLGPELGYGYTFAGSIGVVITLPHESTNLIGQSTLDDTSNIVFDLIESKGLEQTARRLGPQPIEAMNEWIEVHSKNHFGMGLQWRSENAIRREVQVDYVQLASLQSAIYNTETKSISHIPGELFAVDTQARTFSFRADDGKVISGTFDEDAISWEHAASVPARYKASILTTTKIVVLGSEPKNIITLSALGDL